MIRVIAEIGCNHRGDLQIAKDMIYTAAMFCKADIVKLQKRNNKELLSPHEYDSPHPNPVNSYGRTYGEHREFLEFNIDQHKQLKDWCDEIGIEYSTSVWDVTSAKEMASLNPKLLKVPSASNLNRPLLLELINGFGGEIHISFGMTEKKEEEKIVELFLKNKRSKDLVIYSCTSGYPVAFKDVCLREIERLKENFAKDVKSIGFSGHHLGIAVDMAAVALGASHIERHFTLDRTWKGTDHAASLEPDGLRKLCRDVKAVSAALTFKPSKGLEVEANTWSKLKKTQVRWD